jgi:hypothetical protein
MSDKRTINLDFPHDYWKRDRLRVTGVSRDAENDKSLLLSLSRPAEDDELRRIHEHLKGLWQ